MKINVSSKKLQTTALYEKHKELGAKIIDFNGWSMPLHYNNGIIKEHLSTRKSCGLFDISHMGRLIVMGQQSLPFLQYVFTNNAASLEVGESQYTILSTQKGSAIDDAYLYRLKEDEYLLVLNSSNLSKDLIYLKDITRQFNSISLINKSKVLSMLSLQGPESENILLSLIRSGHLPKLTKNKMATVNILGSSILLARTGYTGEEIGYELFVENDCVLKLWETLIKKGASPVGLGARDSLRLEAKLPLYGHELGKDHNRKNIPILSCPTSKVSVDLSQDKRKFVGRKSLEKQYKALKKILKGDYSSVKDLPKVIVALELIEKAVARSNDIVFLGDSQVGHITSGTVVPYWNIETKGNRIELTDKFSLRSIALALVDSEQSGNNIFEVEIRKKRIKAFAMPYFLKKAQSHLYPVTYKDFHNKKELKNGKRDQIR